MVQGFFVFECNFHKNDISQILLHEMFIMLGSEFGFQTRDVSDFKLILLAFERCRWSTGVFRVHRHFFGQ